MTLEQFADSQALRILRNLIRMLEADVPPDQMRGYLSLEHEFLEHLPGQLRVALESARGRDRVNVS